MMLVLIVEDNPLVAMDLREIVLDNADAEIVLSESVASTRELLDHPFDFVFFDIDLPDGKSFSVAFEMMARGIPFAFVSASKSDELPSALRDMPFISKPFMPADIARVLRRLSIAVH